MTEKRFTTDGIDIIDNRQLIEYVVLEKQGRELVVDLLNEQEEEIRRLKWSNKILRANKKDCELGRKEERKRWNNMDKMRVEHIRLLQKRLKENGLSIYVYGDVE